MVHTLDLHHAGVPEAIAAHAIDLGGGRVALVDPGPGSTVATLFTRLRELGVEASGIAAIFISHVHLDHAGAAGALARASGAMVYAHPRAAPHLLDPSRLLASAARIYGGQMEALWGSMLPVPEGQLRVLSDDEVVELGALRLRAIEAPGHANHQHAYLSAEGALFPGDAAAIRLPGQRTLMPATAPPEIDLPAWSRTLERFEAARVTTLYLPHFGPVRDVAEHFARLRAALAGWAALIRAGIAAGEDNHALAARLEASLRSELRAEGASAEASERAIRAAGPMMCALGLRRALTPKEERA